MYFLFLICNNSLFLLPISFPFPSFSVLFFPSPFSSLLSLSFSFPVPFLSPFFFFLPFFLFPFLSFWPFFLSFCPLASFTLPRSFSLVSPSSISFRFSHTHTHFSPFHFSFNPLSRSPFLFSSFFSLSSFPWFPFSFFFSTFLFSPPFPHVFPLPSPFSSFPSFLLSPFLSKVSPDFPRVGDSPTPTLLLWRGQHAFDFLQKRVKFGEGGTYLLERWERRIGRCATENDSLFHPSGLTIAPFLFCFQVFCFVLFVFLFVLKSGFDIRCFFFFFFFFFFAFSFKDRLQTNWWICTEVN